MLALSGKVIVVHGAKRGPALEMHARLQRLKCGPYMAKLGLAESASTLIHVFVACQAAAAS